MPVVLLHGMNDFLDGVAFFDGHQLEALVMEGAVHADGEVAFRLFEETLEVGDEAAGRDGDAGGTPAQGPFLREDV